MNVTINGQPAEFSDGLSLLDVVVQHGAQAPFALAVNGQFIPKSQHAETQIKTQDSIEILSPVQGG
ncbi:sulfur carrier protein ThiS [Catenovulum sediminis]|uniref:Sulfur carrier protein ThiS n=1 Tax=Catenovulum sediminis TaxID=1740262 RepID=A0ABV1REQ8_9ALTE|nr:sulfur carrier protein ThiS [Catenovulum sediminis]